MALLVPVNIETLAAHVLGEACERGLRLATAESCTGGLVASALTDVPGRSHAFAAGLITYSPQSKIDLLGVDAQLLDAKGAVSTEVAAAMAQGALIYARADVAVSITGYADSSSPGSTGGLVYFGVAGNRRPLSVRRETFGDIGREAVRAKALRVALELFRSQIV